MPFEINLFEKKNISTKKILKRKFSKKIPFGKKELRPKSYS